MKEFQFTIVFLMLLLSLALALLLPKEVKNNAVINRSRWLMFTSLVLIGLQFLIQFISDYRSRDMQYAVIVNLTFFIPCAATMTLGILNLQRQGRLSVFERWIYVPVWLTIIAMLTLAVVFNDHPTDGQWSRLLWTEVLSCTIFTAVQIYFSVLQFREVSRINEMLNNYYDLSGESIISWMQLSVVLLISMGLFVPFLLFGPIWLLMIYGLAFFTGLFFLWFSFMRYVISGAAETTSDAENENVKEGIEKRQYQQSAVSKTLLSDEAKQRVAHSVEQWVTNNLYLRKGLTSPNVAREMQLPRYQLQAWIKDAGYSSFSNWITTLRVNYAKMLLLEHPDWSNEAIADQCGISRSHLQKVFRELTGMTPAQFIAVSKK